MSLKSSVEQKGKVITKIITFKGGYKKTIRGVLTDSIFQSEFCHFDTEDGRHVMVNPPNVLLIEVFTEDE